jgi:hypothetical protein
MALKSEEGKEERKGEREQEGGAGTMEGAK